MSIKKRDIILACLAVILAGCLHGSSEADSASGQVDVALGPWEEKEHDSNATGPNWADSLLLNNCDLFVAVASWEPGGAPRANGPSQWRERETATTDKYYAIGMICKKVVVGPYVRDTSFLWEATNQFQLPLSCEDRPSITQLAVHQVWISDEKIAGFLSEREPVGVVGMKSMERAIDPAVGPTYPETWRWWNDTHLSEVHFMPTGLQVEDSFEYRLYWGDRNITTRISISFNATLPNTQVIPAHGRLGPPTLYAESGRPLYIERASIYLNASMTTRIDRFEGPGCE